MECSSSPRALAEPLESRTLLSATVTGTPTIVNASKLPGSQATETIVYNPTNPNQMYMVAENTGASGTDTSLLTSTSTDGGKTWAPMLRFTGGDGFPPAALDPSAAYDSFGNLFVAYKRADTGSTEVVYSYDNGQTFHVLASLKGIQDMPVLTTGPGAVWLGLEQAKLTGNPASVATAGAVVYRAKVSGLGRISALNRVAKLTGVNSLVDSMATGPAGQVVAAYQYATALGPSVIYIAADPDGLGPQNFKTINTGITSNIGTSDLIPALQGSGISANASLAFDDSADAYTGRLYLVYADASSPASVNSNIYLRYSDDNGLTWSSPAQVNDDSSPNSHFMPAVAVDPVTGAVAVTWYDSRNDNGVKGVGGTNQIANDDEQVYGAVGTPTRGGVSFSPNVRIQPAFSNANDIISNATSTIDANQFGTHNGLTFYNSRLSAAWADDSNSTGDNADGTLTFPDTYVATANVTVTNPPSGTLVGSFGPGVGTLKYTLPDGTRATFRLSKGYGYLFADSSGNLKLRLSDTTTTSALTITAAGGSRRVALTDVSDSGPLGSISAHSVDLTGTFSIAGSVNRVSIGNISGGTFAASGAIGTMNVASLTNSKLLSGASPGADNVFSGAGDTDDSFAAGSIRRLVVFGAIANSVIGAGVNPVDGVFGNGNDTIIGGAASRISSLRAASADSTSHFEAGAFGTVRIPELVDPSTDARFFIG